MTETARGRWFVVRVLPQKNTVRRDLAYPKKQGNWNQNNRGTWPSTHALPARKFQRLSLSYCTLNRLTSTLANSLCEAIQVGERSVVLRHPVL